MSEILKTTPLKGNSILFCGCGLKPFASLGGTNSKNKTKHIFIFCLSVFLLAQYPKRFRKNSSCEPLAAEHPERWQKCFKFLALKSTMSSAILVIWESNKHPLISTNERFSLLFIKNDDCMDITTGISSTS